MNTAKTRAGIRTIPMSAGVVTAFGIQKHYARKTPCSMEVDGFNDFIFTNRFGDVQHQGTLNKALRERIIRDCNAEAMAKNLPLLPRFSCHTLRHTFCTNLCAAGVDVKTIADQTSYDTMDYYTVKGILMSLGSVSLILPSLWIATWIVRDRPVSSMSSSRGGWNWKAFFQCFLLAIPLYIASSIYDVVTLPKIAFDVKFSLESLAVLLLAVPIQCIAEEYLFRGFFAQTFASWTKIPWIGILVSTAIFTAMHPYSIEGIIEVAITGLCFGILAWRTKGLEASSAMHMMNNLTVFLMAGCGLSNVQTSVPYESVIISACLNLVYLLVILLLANRKWNWFTAKRDKLTKWNQKRMDKAARKAARKQNA